MLFTQKLEMKLQTGIARRRFDFPHPGNDSFKVQEVLENLRK
jgi:hypothetical protein